MRIIPRTPKDFLVHFASGAAIHYSITALENFKLRRHYQETRTPQHARHMRSWRMPPIHDRAGKTIGFIVGSPITPVAAALAGGVAIVAGGTAVNEITRSTIDSTFYTTPFTSGFGSVV